MKTHYITIWEYAQLCEITTQGVYKRINQKKIKSTSIEKVGQCIDLNKYPPEKRKSAGRKRIIRLQKS